MRAEPIHLLILLIIVVVIFGAAKLPSVAKNLGQSMKIFRNEVKDMREDEKNTPEAPKQLDKQVDASRAERFDRQTDDYQN